MLAISSLLLPKQQIIRADGKQPRYAHQSDRVGQFHIALPSAYRRLIARQGGGKLFFLGGFIVLGVLCAVWRALAQKRKAYLTKEARNLVDVHSQKEADREQ